MKLLDLIFKLTLWFLLTADMSFANVVIGFCVALLLPRVSDSSAMTAQQTAAGRASAVAIAQAWLQMLWKIAAAIPRAYIEAFEMIFNPHSFEEIVIEQGKPRQTRGLVFLDIFLITFTPKTIVVNYASNGQYTVHTVSRRRPS
ncbi:MAG: Na+/H+ antiporter subunit E [Phormidesmis sp.]